MSNLDYQLFYRRHLPHYQPPGSTVFVTFRLANSLPVEVIRRLMEEAARIDRELDRISDSAMKSQQAYVEHRRMFAKWDTELDTSSYGPHWLRDRQVASLVAEGLHYRDGKAYALDGYSLMPNHAHVVFTPLKKNEVEYHTLSAIMHSLKRHTAQAANALLHRTANSGNTKITITLFGMMPNTDAFCNTYYPIRSKPVWLQPVKTGNGVTANSESPCKAS